MTSVRILRCDGCLQETSKDKLKRAFIQWGPARAKSRYASPSREGVQIDLCVECRDQFSAAVKPYVGDAGLVKLMKYLYPIERVKKVK